MKNPPSFRRRVLLSRACLTPEVVDLLFGGSGRDRCCRGWGSRAAYHFADREPKGVLLIRNDADDDLLIVRFDHFNLKGFAFFLEA